MLKKKNAQGISITTIIVAVIALVVLVVLIGIFREKIGGVSRELDTFSTCDSSCKGVGYDKGEERFEGGCTLDSRNKIMPGSYSDVDENKVCCCMGEESPSSKRTDCIDQCLNSGVSPDECAEECQQ